MQTWIAATAPLRQRQHSNHLNKHIKRSADADVSESKDRTRQRSTSALAAGWFDQLDQARLRPPLFERPQNTSSSQLLQPSEVFQRLLIHQGLPTTRGQDAGGSGRSVLRSHSDPRAPPPHLFDHHQQRVRIRQPTRFTRTRLASDTRSIRIPLSNPTDPGVLVQKLQPPI